VTQVLVALALAAAAAGLSRARRLGLERDIAVAAVRAALQLAAVGLLLALVFEREALGVLFVAVMLLAASLTSGRRLAGVARGTAMAGAAIAAGAAAGLVPLLASGAFGLGPRELVPVAGILIGGAMAATSLTGRRLLDEVRGQLPVVEARLALGAGAREALAPVVRTAVATGLIPVIDQTRTVGLVTLPGTFVGLVLGGASAGEAARVQLTVLLSLLGVELVAALAVAALLSRALVRPGERVVAPGGPG
jgi:putative ABC transport system permease protein